MPGVIHPPILFWQVHEPPTLPPSASDVPDRGGSADPEHWHSQAFAVERQHDRKRKATRYEKFTTRMVLLSSVIMLGVTMCLHLANYGLETKTSSTSGTHSNFYKEDE